MILVPRAVRVYFRHPAGEPAEVVRRALERIRHSLGYDPLEGHLFVFLNRRKNQVKLLIVWTRGGFTITHKRLERGTFTFPAQVTSTATSVRIDVHELAMLLEGIDVSRAKAKPRWEPPARALRRASQNGLSLGDRDRFRGGGHQNPAPCPAAIDPDRPLATPRGTDQVSAVAKDPHPTNQEAAVGGSMTASERG